MEIKNPKKYAKLMRKMVSIIESPSDDPIWYDDAFWFGPWLKLWDQIDLARGY